MNKKITVSVSLAITIIAMTVTFAITWLVSMTVFDRTVSSVTQLQAQYTKIAEIDNYVRNNYSGEIDDNQLFDRISAGYIAGLGDRYSAYYTEAQYANILAEENGSRVGVGVEVVREADGNYRVARVYGESPASRAGVAAGMTIVSVDGVDARSFGSAAALRNAMMGEQGTELTLECSQGLTEALTYPIRRINYSPPTVEMQILGGYAYIRIHGVGQNTFADFDYEIRQAQAAEVRGLVFDVRGLNGALYSPVYRMIDLLCPRGTVAKSENKNGTTSVLATSDENFVDKPMVVIVDGNTAGSAELFAVSLRDFVGAQLVGVKTAGNGTLLSQPYRLADGSAITIPVAKLVTGRDKSYDGVGLLPDVEVPGEDVTEAMLYDPRPTQDSQIRRAFETIRVMVIALGQDPGTGMDPPAASSVETSQPALLPPDGSEVDDSGVDTSGADDSGAGSNAEDSAASGSSSR